MGEDPLACGFATVPGVLFRDDLAGFFLVAIGVIGSGFDLAPECLDTSEIHPSARDKAYLLTQIVSMSQLKQQVPKRLYLLFCNAHH